MNGTFVGTVRGFSPWTFSMAILVNGTQHLGPSVLVQGGLLLSVFVLPLQDCKSFVGLLGYVLASAWVPVGGV